MSESTTHVSSPGRLVGLVSLLLGAMAAGTLIQFAIPVLGPLIIRDLGLSRTQFGSIMAVYFLCTAAMAPRGGSITDRIAHRHTIAGCFAFGGLSMIAMGVAHGVVLLGVMIVLGAAGSALSNPGTNRVVLARVAPRARGMVVGAKQSGVQVATILSGLLLPPLAAAFGWRAALVGAGVLLLVAAVVIDRFDLGRPQAAAPGHGRDTPRLRDHPRLLALCVYSGLMGAGMACVATYLPTYAFEVAGWSLATAGALAATIGSTGVVARLVWGWVAGRADDPLRPLPWLAAAATAGCGLLVADPGGLLLWTAAVVFGLSSVGWVGVAMLASMTIAGSQHAGWAAGRVILAFYLGLGLSPIPFGGIVDRTGNWWPAWLLVAVLFAASWASLAVPRATRRHA